MELYDLTLQKEVAREGAWEIKAKIFRIQDKLGESRFLDLLDEKISSRLRDIPKMSMEDVVEFRNVMKFVIEYLDEIEEED